MSTHSKSEAITEASNDLTENMDVASTTELVSMLKLCDDEIFSGWRNYKSIFHETTIAVIDAVRDIGAEILKDPTNGMVVLSGCGTSGRLAFMAARTFNSKLTELEIKPCFRYTIAGGDEALFTSQESSEDDPHCGVELLKKVTSGKSRVLLIGITCGLSAPFVAGQLDYCLKSLDVFTPVLLGFNPIRLARNLPIAKWNKTFLQVAEAMEDAEVEGRAHILNPVVGPEQVTGSSRMKCGTATKILLDTIFVSAYMAVFHPETAHCTDKFMTACREICNYVYSHKERIAKLVTLAGESLKTGGHIYYIARDSLGLVGMIDASECPPTFGASLDDVRGFIEDGFAFMKNNQGNISHLGKHFCISLGDFRKHILPIMTDKDLVICLIKDDGKGFCKDMGEWSCKKAVVTFEESFAKSKGLPKYVLCSDVYISLVLPEDKIVNICGELVWLEWIHLFCEVACKWICNAVSTGAHVVKGKIYRNIMVDVRVSNNKLFHRAVGIIERFAKLPESRAETFLLRSIYNTDCLTIEQETAEIAEHIKVAAPQDKIVPCALMQACLNCSTTKAQTLLAGEPVIRTVCSSVLEKSNVA